MRTFLLLVLIMSVLAGCNTKQENSASPSQDYKQMKVQQTNPPKRDIKNPREVAQRLEKLALSIPEVKAANCVVFGDTAIIGIDVKGNLDRSRVGTIKYSVAEAIRKDPYGANALVTADLDMGERIREMRRHMMAGHPIAGFGEELADMIGRIMPQLPRDVDAGRDPRNKAEGSKRIQQDNM